MFFYKNGKDLWSFWELKMTYYIQVDNSHDLRWEGKIQAPRNRQFSDSCHFVFYVMQKLYLSFLHIYMYNVDQSRGILDLSLKSQ